MARRTSLTIVTPPTVEPITLDEVKNWLKQDGNDDDALITTLISAAREHAELFLRRALISQRWKLTLDLEQCGYANDLPGGLYDLPISALYGGLPDRIDLPYPPLVSVTSVTTYDINNTGTVFDPTNYLVDTAGARIALNSNVSWPVSLRQTAACEIVFNVGYGATGSDVPQGIKSGMLVHIQRMYDQRVIADLPPQAEQLMRSYRVYG